MRVEEIQLDKMMSNEHFAIGMEFNTLFVVLSQRSNSASMPRFSHIKRRETESRHSSFDKMLTYHV